MAWLSLTADELQILAAVTRVGRLRGEDMLDRIAANVERQARSRFGAVRLSNEEIQALGGPFKTTLDGLKQWGSPDLGPLLADALAQGFPGLEEGTAQPSILVQKVQALRVRIGLQKAWTRQPKPGEDGAESGEDPAAG